MDGYAVACRALLGVGMHSIVVVALAHEARGVDGAVAARAHRDPS